MCKSYHTVGIEGEKNLLKCALADQSLDQEESKLIRYQGAGLTCNYTIFKGTDPKSQSENKTDVSICGFNSFTHGFCRKRKGDTWFVDAYSRIMRIDYAKMNCHIMSSVETCYAFTESKTQQENLRKWYTALQDVDYDYGWPLYAENDECVKDTITDGYWDVKEPDYSYLFAPRFIFMAAFIMWSLF